MLSPQASAVAGLDERPHVLIEAMGDEETLDRCAAAIDDAVNAMTSTSNPSIMLMTTQIVTARTCTGRMGPSFMLATMSVVTFVPSFTR